MRVWLLLVGAAGLSAQSVVISQIYGGGGNTGAVWRNDFVELFNRGAAPVSMSGWSVQYAPATGTTWQVAPIDGTIEPGQYFLVQLAAGAGGTQSLPAPDASGSLALGSTAGKIALSRNTTPLHEASGRPFVQDLVGYGAAATDFKVAPTRDLSNTTAAIRAGGGCVDTGNNQADFAIGAPVPRNRASARNDCSAGPGTALRLKISEIQGSGDTSPYVDKRVVTRGVVHAKKSNGFFLESLAADEDNDPTTSEGLFVFTSSAAESAVIGDLVEVEGTVTEFRPASDPRSSTTTELINVAYSRIGTGDRFRRLTFLSGDGDWERFEGMHIMLASGYVSGPTGGTFNESSGQSASNGVFYATLSHQRPFRRPGESGDSTKGILRVDSRALGGVAAETTSGDFWSASGALDHGGRTYTLLAEQVGFGQLASQPVPVPAPTQGEFLIATLNLQRFFATQTAFATRVAKLKLYIQDILRSPDVIAVQEVGSQTALDRVAADLGGYRAFVGGSNDPSGIAPGFLVKNATATALSTAPYASDLKFGTDNQLVHDRPPFRLDVRIGGQRMALLCVHIRSLNDIEDPRVQAKRRAQAESINSIARGIAAENVPFAILGDFNSFPFDDGYADMLGLIGSGLSLTSINPLLKNGDSYSYVFNGATQALDHILVNPAMRQWMTRAAYARANADYPESARADAASPARISDHDAAVAWFRADAAPFTALSITSAASYQTGSIAPGEILTVFGRDLNGTRMTIGGRTATLVYQSATQWSIAAPLDLPVGGTVELALERNGQKAYGVEVPVAASAPALFSTRPSGRPGDIIQLWGTGAGDGQTTTARMCGQRAEVLYSGQAPGLVAGAWQLNVRIPNGCAPGANTVEVSAGARTSPEIGITIRD
ncbi:MAG: lamin tail domain-containing protein [Acidobacteria bacterium]|nr:lamin tail domain-containing protein [Acidobacteriota bacterium]